MTNKTIQARYINDPPYNTIEYNGVEYSFTIHKGSTPLNPTNTQTWKDLANQVTQFINTNNNHLLLPTKQDTKTVNVNLTQKTVQEKRSNNKKIKENIISGDDNREPIKELISKIVAYSNNLFEKSNEKIPEKITVTSQCQTETQNVTDELSQKNSTFSNNSKTEPKIIPTSPSPQKKIKNLKNNNEPFENEVIKKINEKDKIPSPSKNNKGNRVSFIKTEITLDNQEKAPLFLQDLDETELKNYEIINDLIEKDKKDKKPKTDVNLKSSGIELSNLKEFLPQYYGQVEKNGKRYLVMKDFCKDNEGDLTPLVDIKLAGKINQKGFDPIEDQKELKFCHGKKKSILNISQIKNPKSHFLIANQGKLSDQNTKDNLIKLLNENLPHDKKKALGILTNLKSSLEKLYTIVGKAPIAFIGSNIRLLKKSDGTIKPILTNLAHIQIDPDKQTLIDSKKHGNVYFGEKSDFENRQLSNLLAINTIIKTVEECITPLDDNKKITLFDPSKIFKKNFFNFELKKTKKT